MALDHKTPNPDRRSTRPPPGRRDSVTVSHEGREYLLLHAVDPALELGAKNAVETCLGARHGEQLILVCEKGLEPIGAAIVRAADRVGADVSAFILDADHAGNEPFVTRLSARLEEAETSILIASVAGLPAEFRRLMLRVGGRRRHAHMVGITEAMMRQSMRADYEEVHAIGERLLRRLEPTSELRVQTSAGTNIVVRGHPQHRWHNASGLLRSAGWANLPGGEVFSTPLSVDGLVVPDGGMFMPDGTDVARGGRLRVRFARGSVTAIEGPGGDELLRYLEDVPHGARVGQAGFGTNTSLLTSVGALLQDLKMPGFHLSLGYTCAELTSAEWSSPIEVPMLMRRADVAVDGEPLMVRGRFARGIGPT